jgi:FkbH-like protein
MVLKMEDISAYRINWRDKASNIVEIVKELNVGLQSVVFIDDNPVERARVREALPEVFVPEWPEDKMQYVPTLLSLRCFDVPSISQEDLERTKMYAQERARGELKAQFTSLDEWLGGLDIRVRFEALGPSNLPRTTQLLNKTNQMNIRTRRLSEAELLAWAREPNHELWAVHVSDKFGDAGLTGILGLEFGSGVASVVDYVLSCRVMGRKVEETLVWAAVERAKQRGVKRVIAPFFPTAKNKPALTFWQGSSGFAYDEAANTFTWDGSHEYAIPRCITALGLESSAGGREAHLGG